jgi:PAS domain S-box-containing protein
MITPLEDQIKKRFGVLPNFFGLASKDPDVAANLWGFAQFGYLDNPLPSLFKERLFVYLSRFCEIRYCIARHLGFLVGLGYPAGDPATLPQTVEAVLPLLRRSLPYGEGMAPLLEVLAQLEKPISFPDPDSTAEQAVFACATHVFLQTPDATMAHQALRQALDASKLEHLNVFLSFVRTAHYWTKLHPELSLEDDVCQLLATHEVLAECILKDPDARGDGLSQWIAAELASFRETRSQRDTIARAYEALTVDHQSVKNSLQERETSFRELLSVMPAAIYSCDADGFVTYHNSRADDLWGLEPQLSGQPWSFLDSRRVYRPDGTLLRSEERPVREVLKSGFPIVNRELIVERPDLSRIHVLANIAPLRNARGLICGAVNIVQDVTEIKRAERAALLLSAIVDSSDDAIISKDINGIITSWNESAERLFGYTAAEAIGQSVTMLIPLDRLEEEPQILARLKCGERVDHFETVRRRKDGSLLDISLTISPVRDGQGNIIGASKIARDITERKRTEAALLASEQRFRQLADSMPQIVWTARPDGYLDYYNDRWYEFTGFTRGTFGDASWEPILHPDDVQRCRETWYGAIRSGIPYKIEYRFWDRHEHRWRWFMGHAISARDDDGRTVKWFGSCIDIDDQKRVEDDLRRANEDLEQFAFSASHDLQEPLRSVKIYSELLMESYGEGIDGEAQEFLTSLRGAATRMEMLLHDLLAYTQVTKFDKPAESFNAEEALATALANLSGTVSEAGARITADPLPSLQVHGAHLQQLFQNLIGNAIKYRSPERPPVVHVTAKQQNGNWIFAVADNGIGIRPEYREKIFGLFKRLHTSDEYSGTGIGLAICQRIVDRYHGRIWVESQPGSGSTFRFTLPV